MSKYTVSQLESLDSIQDDDLLMVSTTNEDGSYSSRKVPFSALAAAVTNESSSDRGSSTGNNETDIINFFTPKSTFMVKDSRFMKGDGACLLFLKEEYIGNDSNVKTPVKIATLSNAIMYYDNVLHQAKTLNKNTALVNIPNYLTLNSASASSDISSPSYGCKYIRPADRTDATTYDNSAYGDIDNLVIASDLQVIKFVDSTVKFDVRGYDGGGSDVEAHFELLKIPSLPSNINSVSCKRGDTPISKNFNTLDLTLNQLKQYWNNGYKYILVYYNSPTQPLLNWQAAVQLEKFIDFPVSTSYKFIMPKSSDAVTSYADNAMVYTEEIPITEACAIYVQASFTCQKTNDIGQSYYIELQLKATANAEEIWYPIYRQYAVLDQTGRTSLNYQLFARPGVKIRGAICPQGNAGRIYYNQSNFTFTLCKTSGQFTKKEESVQLLNVEYKAYKSNKQTLHNTIIDNTQDSEHTPVVGRWISLDGSFSYYGGYRRNNIDRSNNLYYLLNRTKITDTQVDPPSDAEADNVGPESDDMPNDILASPIISTLTISNSALSGKIIPDGIGKAVNSYYVDCSNLSNIIMKDDSRIPFYTAELTTRNADYSTYNYFCPAQIITKQNNEYSFHNYGVSLIAANKLGNNSNFSPYGPNTALINKQAITTLPDPINDGNVTKLIFNPSQKIVWTWWYYYNRVNPALVGINSINLDSVDNTTNLAKLELFYNSATNGGPVEYDFVIEDITGATSLFYTAVQPIASTLSCYNARQANIVLNDTIDSIGVAAKSVSKNGRNVGERLRAVASFGSRVNELKDYCFYDCKNMTSVGTQNNNITKIGRSCFENCSKLTGTLKFNKVTSLGKYAFQRCDKLNAIELSGFAGEIPEYTAKFCRALSRVDFRSAKSVGDNAFGDTAIAAIGSASGQSNFNATETVGKSAFYNCGSLTSVSLPACTLIKDYAFYRCTNLKSLTLSSSTPKEIGVNAFNSCPLSGTINLGKVATIHQGAFASADKNFAIFKFDGNDLPTLKSTNAFPNNHNRYTWKIQCTQEFYNALKAHRTWRVYADRCVKQNDGNTYWKNVTT